MKKISLFVTLALCILLLAGCVQGGQAPTEAPAPSESSAAPESTAPESTAPSVSEAEEAGELLGIGFFGYIDSESDEAAVRRIVANSALAKNYPILTACDPILMEGAELYAFVPANERVAVTVYRAELSEDGTYIDHKQAPLYAGIAGEAVILRCNFSEIYSNVLISVTNGTKTLEFRPMISLESGRPVLENGCCDLSVYDDGEDDALSLARSLLLQTDEVRDATQRGMKLLCTGDTQIVEGQVCFVFALGTDREEQFVCEQLYAVSESRIYAYDPETDTWQTLGAG